MNFFIRASCVVVACAAIWIAAGSSRTLAQGATASPAPSPSPSATPAYRFVYLPTPSPATTPFPGPHAPQILEIAMNDQTIVTPGELRVRVLTNPDVTTVMARTMGYEVAITRQSPGLFSAITQIGTLPSFLLGRTYDVEFVAAGQDGRTATVILQLGLK